MEKNHDKLYSILLDVQKQMGDISRETGEQSKMLIALNDKVAIANGRTTKIENTVKEHQSILDNWKGRLAIIVILGGFVGNLIIGMIKDKINL